MYDYAIDKYVPVRFFDYIAKKWSTEKPPVNLTIDEGKLIPGTGLTATQIAREGWGLQKSQNGGGTLPVPAPSSVTYHRYGSRVKTTDQEQTFFDGIDVSLQGIATLATGDTQFLKTGLAGIAAKADQAFAQYSPEKPGAIAPLLAEGLKATRDLIAAVRSSQSGGAWQKRRGLRTGHEGEAVPAGAGGIARTLVPNRRFRAGEDAGSRRTRAGADAAFGMSRNAAFTMAIPGQAFAVEATVGDFGSEPVTLEGVALIRFRQARTGAWSRRAIPRTI